MAYGFKLRVWGDYACFTRPEMKVERVTYDAMTPSAARGVLDAVYWKPAIRWVVDRIHVLNEIRFDSIRRNEVDGKIPVRAIDQASKGVPSDLHLYASAARQQRAAVVLRDVSYVIEAHFELTSAAGPEDTEQKHYNIVLRRLKRGQCYQQPFLGCREFPANVELLDGELPTSVYQGQTVDLGWMLNEIDHDGEQLPRFFRASLVSGAYVCPENVYGPDRRCDHA